MTYDFRRRLRSPLAKEARPAVTASEEGFSAWFESYAKCVLGDSDHDWMNVSNAYGRIIAVALLESGALWLPSERSSCCHPASVPICPHLARMPDGRVSGLKLLSNEGWFVAPEEACFLAEHLDAIVASKPVVTLEEVDADALDAASDSIRVVTREYDLREARHRELVAAFVNFAAFCRRASSFGFEVW